MVRRTLGQCVAVCPRLQLTSHTQQEHHPFENKLWELYFYKEVCSFVHWSSSLRLIMLWTSLKLVDKFTCLGSSVSSTEKSINTRLTKAWTAIDRLSITWKSDQTDKMKRSFFQAVVVSVLLYECTTWTLIKWLEKKLDGNYTRMLRAILNKSWRQNPTRHQLYGHLPPITKTIQARRTRHAGHCWRSRDELISDVLLWTPTYGRAKAGRPAWIYIQQLCEDTRCSPEDLPEAMNDREKWRERVRDIRAGGTTWWYLYMYYVYVCGYTTTITIIIIIIIMIINKIIIIKEKSGPSRPQYGWNWLEYLKECETHEEWETRKEY